MSIDGFLQTLNDEVAKLSLATARIRGLHKKMTHIYGKVACTECGQAWPCQTTVALDQSLANDSTESVPSNRREILAEMVEETELVGLYDTAAIEHVAEWLENNRAHLSTNTPKDEQ